MDNPDPSLWFEDRPEAQLPWTGDLGGPDRGNTYHSLPVLDQAKAGPRYF